MKREVENEEKLDAWVQRPEPAVFQGLDLRGYEAQFLASDLAECVFLGCEMTHAISNVAAQNGCLIVPRFPGLPFNAFEPGLYTPEDLYDNYDPDNSFASYQNCLDRKVYLSYMDPKTKKPIPVDVDVLIARRIHDASIAEALDDFLDLEKRKRVVAIMGGHDFPRNESLYRTIAELCLDLTNDGYLIVTGGGPGLMEAANLGAYSAGFENPKIALDSVISAISKAPKYNHPDWLSSSYRAWVALGKPVYAERCRNIGIPTWFYGHEPPNVFATDIAKYFENSVREEGLLAVALAGVIFAQGNAGTVQELFQDACQNYYATYEDTKSPMILLDANYWAPADTVRHHAGDRRKPVYELIEKLAIEKGFIDRLLVTDSPMAARELIHKFSPISRGLVSPFVAGN